MDSGSELKRFVYLLINAGLVALSLKLRRTVFLVFGGMTLYFHSPLFVKWKPTVIFWVMALVFLGSQFIGKKPLLQRMLEKGLEGATLAPALWI